MIWDVLFWLALAYLAAFAFTRYLLPVFRGGKKVGKKGGAAERSESFGRVWALPILAILVMAGSYWMKANPDVFQHRWTDDERAELERFESAVGYYEQATAISQDPPLSWSDWESVEALLSAALDELKSVDPKTLARLHPELRTHVEREFIPGLQSGIFGLDYYTQDPAKGIDTARTDMSDSLKAGRQLLAKWNAWYAANQDLIIERLE
jgi:hypothetical protein